MRKIFTGLFMVLVLVATFSFAQETGTIKLNSDQTKLKLTSKSQTSFSVVSSISEINTFRVKTVEGDFVQLQLNGYTGSYEYGNPDMPVFRKLIEIPQDANAVVNIISYDEEIIDLVELGIDIKIMPSQPSVSKSAEASDIYFEYNEEIYNKNSFNNNPIVTIDELGEIRGLNLGRINISPVSYNPSSNTIIVYNNINVEVVFENSNIAKTNQNKERSYSPYFADIYKRCINYEPIRSKDVITQYPVKYVIVSDPMFEDALQPFIEWKTRKGFNVVEAYTSNPEVGVTTSTIKTYLQGLYEAGTVEDPAPSFVLFVGDVDQIPAFQATGHVTDLYYCEYTGDIYPEVYYGRFSANNISELQPQIDKTLEYEQYLMPDPSFLDEVVMVSGVDDTWAPTNGNGQINYGTDNYFNATHGITSHTYLYGSGTPITSDQPEAASAIIADISNGVGFVNYTAHCYEQGWADPSFEVSDVSSLTNANKYPLSIGNCCLSNKFNVPECFGEALMRAENKGAIGHIGGSNSTTWDEDFWWGVGSMASGSISANPTYASSGLGVYDGVFHENGETKDQWFVTNGEIIHNGNLAVTEAGGNEDYYWEIYHLMGDPSVMTYFTVPEALTVSYMSAVPIGTNSLQVSTEAGAYVAISQNNVLLDAKVVDGTGVVELSFPEFDVSGSADIVVTKQNRAPYIGTLIIAPDNTNNDAMISSITYPETNNSIFAADINPTIEIQNMGNNNLTQVTVGYFIDSETPVIYNWTGYLSQYAIDIIEFSQITLPSGTHNFTAYTLNPNGVEDDFHAGDTLVKIFNVTSGDAAVLEINGFNDLYCGSDTVNPSIVIKNNSNIDILSLDVNYQIDGGDIITQSLTNVLVADATQTVAFSDLVLTGGNHTVVAFTSNPNNGTDFNTSNDSKSKDYIVMQNPQTISVDITTDDYGSETSWDIANDATGDVIYSGGPFEGGSQHHVEEMCLGEGCYTFTIYDEYGDGINSPGNYIVSNISLSSEIGSGGGDFGSSEIVEFCIIPTDIETLELIDYNIYPNPTSGNIEVNLGNVEADKIEITDVLGKVLFTNNNPAGIVKFDLSDLSEGVYLMKLYSGNSSKTEKIILNK